VCEREKEISFFNIRLKLRLSASRSNSNEETNSFDKLVFGKFVRYLKNYTHAV